MPVCQSVLQRGHGGKAVEGDPTPDAIYKAMTLQRGHGGKAVEGSPMRSRPRIRERRFNGATAVKPWRGVEVLARDPSRVALQRGHGGKAVEGERSGERGRAAANRFNGATAVKPWRVLDEACGIPLSLWLQRGHGGKAVEGALLWGRSVNGHRRAFSSDRQLGAVRRRPTHHRRGGLRAQVVKVQANRVIRALLGVWNTSDRSHRLR